MEKKCKIVVGSDCYALFVYVELDWCFSFGVSKHNQFFEEFFSYLNNLIQLGYSLCKVDFDDSYSLYDLPEGDWVVDEN